MKRHLLFLTAMLSSFAIGSTALAEGEATEISCTIRDSGGLACRTMGKELKALTPEDISSFIDQAYVAAYVNVRSRKGMDRTMFVDGTSIQFKKLTDTKKTGSVSEVAKAKNDLFTEIERKIIKLSDELDVMAANAELVKYDPSIGSDKARRDLRGMVVELEGYRKNRDKMCAATKPFELMTKSNASMEVALSNILYAFQTPDSCMGDFKVSKDKDGSVDIRQLDGVAQKFVERCKK